MSASIRLLLIRYNRHDVSLFLICCTCDAHAVSLILIHALCLTLLALYASVHPHIEDSKTHPQLSGETTVSGSRPQLPALNCCKTVCVQRA